MFKKSTLFLLIIFILCFSACSGDNGDKTSSNPTSDYSTPISSSGDETSIVYCYSDPYYETATTTFYAEIIERKGNFFHVKGIEENDINFRSEFVFSITEETRLYKTGIVPPIEDFTKGDIISITFDGMVLETFPAQISNVELIKLLHDN